MAVTAGEPAGIGPDLCVAIADRRCRPASSSSPTASCSRNARRHWVSQASPSTSREDILARSSAASSRCFTCRSRPPSTRAGSTPPIAPTYCAPWRRRGRLLERHIRRDGDGSRKQSRHQRRRHSRSPATPSSSPSAPHAARRDDAGRGRHARRARDDPSRVARRCGGDHAHKPRAQTLEILRRDLIERFAIARPRVLVAGLNPHAGESGHLGREEIEIISPVLETLRARGYDLIGPLPADTLFHPDRLSTADAVLAMYHDQGLPVLKHASFGPGVNVTLGLPIIRTSVDHGTALDLAGTGRADPGSLLTAIELAAKLADRAWPLGAAGPDRFDFRLGRSRDSSAA